MLPGSLDSYYNICGKSSCHYKDKKNPQKHGPYYRLCYSLSGMNSSMFIKKEDVKAVEKMVHNYKNLRALTIKLALETLKSVKKSGVNATIVEAQELFDANNKSNFWKKKNRIKSDAFRKATIKIRDLIVSRSKWKKECLELRKKNKELQLQVNTCTPKELALNKKSTKSKKKHWKA